MAKKVDIYAPLLKEYKDKELVHYVAERLQTILSAPNDERMSSEADMSLRLNEVNNAAKILFAVDKRMNKPSDDIKVMI